MSNTHVQKITRNDEHGLVTDAKYLIIAVCEHNKIKFRYYFKYVQFR